MDPSVEAGMDARMDGGGSQIEDGRRPRRRAGELARESGDARGAAAWEGRGGTERRLGLIYIKLQMIILSFPING